MRHIDLFSGIGGFALAVDTVWPNSEHIFCDNDPFCQQVIKEHWPNSKIYGDIRTLTANTASQRWFTGGGDRQEGQILHDQNRVSQKDKPERNGWERGATETASVDILTGGFPCQPFSQAGRRQGTAENRYLWPQMFRVIREFHPTWVIAENVRGLVTWNEGMVLEQVCADLESEGYEVQPLIIPAVAVNAPHRRDRIWFIANRNGERGGTQRHGYNQDGQESYEGRQEQPQYRSNGQSGNATYTESWRRRSQGGEMDSQGQSARNSGWDRPWIEVAAELCIVDDGLPNGLVRPRGWRNAALKAAGNAIVPQVAIQIMQAIKLTQ